MILRIFLICLNSGICYIQLWDTAGLLIDNRSKTHMIFIWSVLYSQKSEVAVYLPLFVVCCLVVVDCNVGLRCHVVTRPPVSRGRWWTAGHRVDWPEVRGGIEAAATGSDGLLLDAPDEWWCAWSMRHRGRAVVPPVLPSFLPGFAAGFLDVGMNISCRCVFCWMPMLTESLIGNVVLYTEFSLFDLPSIG